MADSHDSGHHDGPTNNIYLAVFAVLCVCTAISFLVNLAGIAAATALLIIMVVAVVKTTLVGMFFMHVKYDWGKLYFLIIPLVILALMLMVVLLPDTVVGWHHDAWPRD
ncbi:MAG TPA: cytochrome C oxidase subunit IV family protein [Gemmataceae bacterium]|nr:cytochrome C oxidase subunit IV family protein [Gemmataceae bacterium]